MNKILMGCVFSLATLISAQALAGTVQLPLKEQIQTSEGKLCIYSDGQKTEKLVHDGGDECPAHRSFEQ